MKVERGRAFLFEPARFKNDPAVMRMSVAGRGVYVVLFCEAWDMPEPGVLPDDNDVLSTLARCDFECWMDVRAEVAGAFDTVSRPGFWIQRGLVETHDDQKSYFTNQIQRGREGGIASGRSRASRVGSRGASRVGSTKSNQVVGVEGVEVKEEKEKDSDSPAVTDSDNGQVQTVRTRTGKPAPKRHPTAQEQIAALRASGAWEEPKP